MQEFGDPDIPAIQRTLSWLQGNGMDIYTDAAYARKYASALVKGRALYSFMTWMQIPGKTGTMLLMPLFRPLYESDTELQKKAAQEFASGPHLSREIVDNYFRSKSGDPQTMFLMQHMPAGIRAMNTHWSQLFVTNAGYFMYNNIKEKLNECLGTPAA